MARHDLGRGTPEQLKDFDPSEFQADDWVTYYKNGQWQIGQLGYYNPGNNQVVEARADGVGVYIKELGQYIVLDRPPRKFHYQLGQLDNRYNIENFSLSPQGEVEYVLHDTITKELMEHVNEKVLESLAVLRDTENDIEGAVAAMVNKIKQVAGQTRKPLMDSITALELKVGQMYEKIGPTGNWGELRAVDLQEMLTQVRQLAQEIRQETRNLEKQIAELQTQSQNKQRQAGAQTVEQIFNRRQDQEDAGKTETPQPGQEPERPPVPSDNEENWVDWYADIYNDLNSRDQQGQLIPRLKLFLDEVNRRRKALAEIDGQHDDYDFDSNAFRQANAQVMTDLITEWKDLETDIEEVNVEVEQTELRTKISELREQINEIKDVGLKQAYIRQLNDLEKLIEALPEVLATNQAWIQWNPNQQSGHTVGIPPTSPNLYTSHNTAPEAIIDYWRGLGDLEVQLFHYNRQLEGRVISPEVEADQVELPTDLVMELLSDRWGQVEQVMSTVYKENLVVEEREEKVKVEAEEATQGEESSQKESREKQAEETTRKIKIENTTVAVRQALLSLFERQPNLSSVTWERLRQHGIKNWEQFKKLWESHLAEGMALGLHQMADDEVTRDTSRSMGRLGKMWATKEHVLPKIAANVVLVGGLSAVAASIVATLAAGGWAVAGATVVGGAVGAYARGGLGKLVDMIPGVKKHREKKIKGYQDKMRTAVVADKTTGRGMGILGGLRRFGNRLLGRTVDERTKSAVDFTSGTEQSEDRKLIFAAMLAEGAADTTSQLALEQTEVAGADQLTEQGRKLFIAGLRKAKQEGRELSETDKLDFIRVIQILHGQGNHDAQIALDEADPFILQVVNEFLQGYGGQKLDGTWRGRAVTGTAGALMGLAFQASKSARAGLGGLASFAEAYSTSKLDVVDSEVKSLQTRAAQALRYISTWRGGTALTPKQTQELNQTVELFSVLVAGGGDQHQRRAVRTAKGLSSIIERVVTEHRGLLKQDFVSTLENLRQDREKVDKDQQKFWGRKFVELAKRFRHGGLRIIKETMVGAGVSLLMGEMFDAIKGTETGQDMQAWIHENVGTQVAHVVTGLKDEVDKTNMDHTIEAEPVIHNIEAGNSHQVLDHFLAHNHINSHSPEAHYLKGLVDKYPELNNNDALHDIHESGGHADNFIRQGGAHKMAVFKELMQHGDKADAAKFLHEQHFSQRHLSYLKSLGCVKGGHLDADKLIEQYQEVGDKGYVADSLERALQAKTNTDLANFARSKGGNEVWSKGGPVKYIGASYGDNHRPDGLYFEGSGKVYVVDVDRSPVATQISPTVDSHDTNFDLTVDEDELGEFPDTSDSHGVGAEHIGIEHSGDTHGHDNVNDVIITQTGGGRTLVHEHGVTYEMPTKALAARVAAGHGSGSGSGGGGAVEAAKDIINNTHHPTKIIAEIYDGKHIVAGGGGSGAGHAHSAETDATNSNHQVADHQIETKAVAHHADNQGQAEGKVAATGSEHQSVEQILTHHGSHGQQEDYLKHDENDVFRGLDNKISSACQRDSHFYQTIKDIKENDSLTDSVKLDRIVTAYEHNGGYLSLSEQLMVKGPAYFNSHPNDFAKVNPIDNKGNELQDGRIIWVAKYGSDSFREINPSDGTDNFYSLPGSKVFPDGDKIGIK